MPPEADIFDTYWVDLKVCCARETLLPTREGVVGREGEFYLQNDGWGRVIRTKPGTFFMEPVERILNDPSDLDKIRFDPADLDLRYTEFVKDVEYHRAKGRPVFIKIGGPFIRTTFFRGEEEFLVDLASDEKFAAELVGRMGDHLLEIGLESLKRTNAWDTGLWIFDDMCNLNAPMFSPRSFERIFLPVYKKIVATLKAAGCRRVFVHCDGNLNPFLDMLVDAGIGGINPVEPAAGMDVIQLLKKYRGKLCFVGGLCNSHVLPCRDPNKIRRHVEAVIEAGKDGGLVIGTHTIGPDISVDNYELYRRIVAEKGTYKA